VVGERHQAGEIQLAFDLICFELERGQWRKRGQPEGLVEVEFDGGFINGPFALVG
jgi:hypothetical protein